MAKNALNSAAAKRLISKQEAMVLLADLDLTYCTEDIRSLSINNSKAIKIRQEDNKRDASFLSLYGKRPKRKESLSLQQYFLYINNTPSKIKSRGGRLCIPNFVGVFGRPCYPVSEAYARQTIIVHKPWRAYPVNKKWIDEFNNFIRSPDCSVSCRLAYERVMKRYWANPKATTMDHSGNAVDQDSDDIMTLAGLKQARATEKEQAAMKSMVEQLDFGKDHNWDRPSLVRTDSK